MPWVRSASSRAMRSRRLRPKRSGFQTMNVSPIRRALRQRVRAERFTVAPETPSSVTIVVEPAFCNTDSGGAVR
jgi:hypothetical protein